MLLVPRFLTAHKSRLTSRETYRERVYPRVLDDIVKVVGYQEQVAKAHLQNRLDRLCTPSEERVAHDSFTSLPFELPSLYKDHEKYTRNHRTALADQKRSLNNSILREDSDKKERPVWIRRWSAWIAPSWHSHNTSINSSISKDTYDNTDMSVATYPDENECKI